MGQHSGFIAAARRAALAAGWRVERCRNGERWYAPALDVPPLTVHYTHSDARAVANLRADLRRRGLRLRRNGQPEADAA